MKSIILLSGGLDSTTTLAIAKRRGDDPVLALSVFYGQRHVKELQSAEDVAKHYSLPHTVVDLSTVGAQITSGTALVGTNEALPEGRSVEEMSKSIPRSYVPGRNTMMLGVAQSIAEALDVERIYVGFNAVDYSGYPDCRPHFVNAWNNLAHYATSKGVNGRPILVEAPVIMMSKAAIVQQGLNLEVPYNLTWSCYKGEEKACGRCDSCIIRYKAFREVGSLDPISYSEVPA